MSPRSQSFPIIRPWIPSFLLSAALLLLSTPLSTAANTEATALLSWLHSSNTTTPPTQFFNWNSHDPHPCNWTFITCNPGGLVSTITIQSIPLYLPLHLLNLSAFVSLTKLHISHANLTGVIPQAIVNRSQLTTIDLHCNHLYGVIPSGLGRLQNLESLVLNENRLSGSIPADLGNCSGLKDIVLLQNQLSGTIPREFGRLGMLRNFGLGQNSNITGEIPRELGNCTNLLHFRLDSTGVYGTIPPSMGRLRKLTFLSIADTMIAGEIPPELGNCSELVHLKLYQNSLSGKIPPEIGKLSNLQRLWLWANNLVGALPPELGNCSRLKDLQLAMNSLSGTIPTSLGNLGLLQNLGLYQNKLTGTIPAVLSRAKSLQKLGLHRNKVSGMIPPELGETTNLTHFTAWHNRLVGSIPSALANCTSLQELDLSKNSLTGSVPPAIFGIHNLTSLILRSNKLSGPIPPEIGACTSLYRLNLADNLIDGVIPMEIGRLTNLTLLSLSGNRLSGTVPDQIGGCAGLQTLDLCSNSLEGPLPNSILNLSNLQILKVSENELCCQIPSDIGRLKSLKKLSLNQNSFAGEIPKSLGHCSGMQYLDLSSNQLSGSIPEEIAEMEALETLLNLSFNVLSGPIPNTMSSLSMLTTMDLSHNFLEGSLDPLANLDYLSSLNISYNHFAAAFSDSKICRQLSAAERAGNGGLCVSQIATDDYLFGGYLLRVIVVLLTAFTVVILILGVFALVLAQRTCRRQEESCAWKVIPFQKYNFSVEQVLNCLVDTNVIGEGCSGVVYRADMGNGEIIAVKKLWPSEHNYCSAEIRTAGSIRHKNIVRFLGCIRNGVSSMLMYDYMPQGCLGSLLHERPGAASSLGWDCRYNILLGVAQGLSYLHHDCVPPIVHRDIKANNILIGLKFEPYIADFGLAKFSEEGSITCSSDSIPGSFGYIAPEYGHMMKITEKSDVYSYGVVVLEVLTGKRPVDPTTPSGGHVVDWVREMRGGIEVLDPMLLSLPDPEVLEIMQALCIALFCVNSNPIKRPTMKDVVAMIMEIKHGNEEYW